MIDKPAIGREIARVHGETTAYLKQLRGMQSRCRNQPLKSGYDFALYLALRRGLLLVEAQLAWLGEVGHYLGSGALERKARR